jgi:hypothetical protein
VCGDPGTSSFRRSRSKPLWIVPLGGDPGLYQFFVREKTDAQNKQSIYRNDKEPGMYGHDDLRGLYMRVRGKTKVAATDVKLYELLALVDAIRDGRA